MTTDSVFKPEQVTDNPITDSSIRAATEMLHECLADMAVSLHSRPNGIAAAKEGAVICGEMANSDIGSRANLGSLKATYDGIEKMHKESE